MPSPPPAPDSSSSTATRLTGRGVLLLLLSLGVTVLGAVLPEPAAVQLGLLGMVLVAAAWPLAARNLTGLAVEREYPDSAFAGQLFPYTLTLRQELPGRVSRAVEVEDTVAGPAERGLDALCVTDGTSAARTFETRLLRRGTLHRARAILTSVFPLGLWQARREIRDSLPMLIFPRPVPPRALDDAQDAALLDAEEDESARRDWSGDFHGIRAFQPGDRLKLIHWPATARARQIMIRQFDRRLPEKYSVLFHSVHPGPDKLSGPDAFESALELLCGLICHCRDRAIPLELTASFDRWRSLSVPHAGLAVAALDRLAAARRHAEDSPARLLQALSTVGAGARVFVLSDVPVRVWEPLLPELPFAVTCLSVTDLRIKHPGPHYRRAAPSGFSAAG